MKTAVRYHYTPIIIARNERSISSVSEDVEQVGPPYIAYRNCNGTTLGNILPILLNSCFLLNHIRIMRIDLRTY